MPYRELNIERKIIVCQILSWRFSTEKCAKIWRPIEVDDIYIKVIIDSDSHSTTSYIPESLNVPHISNEKILKQTIGYTKKLFVCISHLLKVIDLRQYIIIYSSRLKRNVIYPFLKLNIIGIENWIVHNRTNRKILWVMQDELAQMTLTGAIPQTNMF